MNHENRGTLSITAIKDLVAGDLDLGGLECASRGISVLERIALRVGKPRNGPVTSELTEATPKKGSAFH